jgi:hypothetical protein
VEIVLLVVGGIVGGMVGVLVMAVICAGRSDDD